ncbi:uncharacterized protein HMPREF1541_06586 [Cyphellophora europaea CBS 101466]|uniref:Uncharacterized protein n=1 Tax=Cyphellophora europaea (strain CBS 101466) TaxID=1220924 RepID=W2RQF7_CYPE1|nr:uncharacterized protein HMPREF1541_06586 [Cyphellophora europaea CBS 101466]ETN38550.1 hypothetical protein HMPREF1541_06586 [Cyphellophora europaea CBS 101466]
MHLLRNALPLLPFCITGTVADFLLGTYPAPLDLSSDDSVVSASWKNFTEKFDAYLKEGETEGAEVLSGVENITFSVGLFSLHDPAAGTLHYHYASPETVNAVNGTNDVDGDSIYRIASVTKLFTVLAGLLSMTDEQWNTPLAQVFPQLAEYSSENPGEDDPIDTIQWDKITVRALASHLASFPAGGIPGVDTLSQLALTGDPNALVTSLGFPPADLSELGPCWTSSDFFSCSVEDFLENAKSLPPNYLPWSNPSYSNPGFIMLGIAISTITGQPMDTLYNTNIFQPLDLSSSNSTAPTGEDEVGRSVVVGNATEWFAAGGISTPSGGLFSTINDLNKFGIGILNSTIYDADRTREWMKPTTFTASLSYAVGTPWEIIRYVSPVSGKVTDLYTKLGDSGTFGGDLILIPEYNAGISFLNGASDPIRSSAALAVLDQVAEAVLPALEAQAAAEATRNFVGTYASTDPALNYSVTVAFNESTVEGSVSGLTLTGWISNGTDSMPAFVDVLPRLQPSIPNQSDGAGKVAFKASTNPQTSTYAPLAEVGLGPFSGFYMTNGDWTLGDETGVYYAKRPYNRFVFDVDAEGMATAVTPAVTGMKLEKRQKE